MPNETNTTAIVPVEGIKLQAKDFTSLGRGEYAITMPTEGPWFERSIKAMCLKNGPMATESMGNILCAVLYAEEMGLSAILGDLYFVNGRIATTADAKIRHALSSGIVAGYNVEITKGKLVVFTYTYKSVEKEFQTEDLHAKVTVKVKGWDEPVVYEADLKDWFNGANAAWREHTAFMFRKNCLSKALSEVAPLGVDADEIPAQTPQVPKEILEALTSIKQEPK